MVEIVAEVRQELTHLFQIVNFMDADIDYVKLE